MNFRNMFGVECRSLLAYTHELKTDAINFLCISKQTA